MPQQLCIQKEAETTLKQVKRAISRPVSGLRLENADKGIVATFHSSIDRPLPVSSPDSPPRTTFYEFDANLYVPGPSRLMKRCEVRLASKSRRVHTSMDVVIWHSVNRFYQQLPQTSISEICDYGSLFRCSALVRIDDTVPIRYLKPGRRIDIRVV